MIFIEHCNCLPGPPCPWSKAPIREVCGSHSAAGELGVWGCNGCYVGVQLLFLGPIASTCPGTLTVFIHHCLWGSAVWSQPASGTLPCGFTSDFSDLLRHLSIYCPDPDLFTHTHIYIYLDYIVSWGFFYSLFPCSFLPFKKTFTTLWWGFWWGQRRVCDRSTT